MYQQVVIKGATQEMISEYCEHYIECKPFDGGVRVSFRTRGELTQDLRVLFKNAGRLDHYIDDSWKINDAECVQRRFFVVVSFEWVDKHIQCHFHGAFSKESNAIKTANTIKRQNGQSDIRVESVELIS